jgi:restriction system protein
LKLILPERSLFAILLRSPWWISMAIAAALVVTTNALLKPELASLGVFAALPFIVIGAVAAWKQLRAPSPARVAATLEAMQAMSWKEFADALEAAYRADGHAVTRLGDKGADFELHKGGRTTLVAARRWKVARTGSDPLRELVAARDAHDARECLYIALGELTDNARRFADRNAIRIVDGPELARLLPSVGGKVRTRQPPAA